MVEDDHAVVKAEGEVGKPAVIGRSVGKRLGVTDGVVGGEADSTAAEAGKSRQVEGLVFFEHLLEVGEGIGAGPDAGGLGAVGEPQRDLIGPRLENQKRLGAEEAVSSDFFTADDALEQKAGTRSGHLEESAHRREAIRRELAIDRDRGARTRQVQELLKGGQMTGHGASRKGKGLRGLLIQGFRRRAVDFGSGSAESHGDRIRLSQARQGTSLACPPTSGSLDRRVSSIRMQKYSTG